MSSVVCSFCSNKYSTFDLYIKHMAAGECGEKRMQAGLEGFFLRTCPTHSSRCRARGQAVCNLTLTWMKAIVTIENPSMRRMNALTQAFARRMRRSGIFQCEGHAALPSDRRANAVAVNVKRFGTTWQSG